MLAFQLCAICMTGCEGAAATIRADQSRYPVSFSAGVPDSNGDVLLAKRDLDVVGRYEERYIRYTSFYGSVGSKDPLDISQDLNKAITDANGEAVTGLTVQAANCAWNNIWILAWLPFWPGCTVIDIEGDIVRRRAPVTQGAPRLEEAHRGNPGP